MPDCATKLSPAIVALSLTGEHLGKGGGEKFGDATVTCEAGKAAKKEHEDKTLCLVMCCCRTESKRQLCVQRTLDAADDKLNGHSRYKAEVSYNMNTKPPTPFMHRDSSGADTTRRSHRWQTRAKQSIPGYTAGKGLVRRPDIVIVKDPNKPPTQDNIDRVVEMKFAGDRQGPGQYAAYRDIAKEKEKVIVVKESHIEGKEEEIDEFNVMKESQCRCNKDGTER